MSWERQQSVTQWLENLDRYFLLDVLGISELIYLFVEHLLTIHYAAEVNIKIENKTDTFPCLIGTQVFFPRCFPLRYKWFSLFK